MTDKWIGHHIALTNEDGIYDDDGNKVLDLISLNDSVTVSATTHPILYSVVGGSISAVTSPTDSAPWKMVADLTT